MSVARPSMSDALSLNEGEDEEQLGVDSAAVGGAATFESEKMPAAGVLDNKVLMKAL